MINKKNTNDNQRKIRLKVRILPEEPRGKISANQLKVVNS